MSVRTSTPAGDSSADRPFEAGESPDQTHVREYTFGPFRIDVPYCQLWRGEELIALTPKAFDTLVFLVRHRDRIVSREELMTAIWHDAFVSEDTLAQNIWAIRRALGDPSEKQEFIGTVPRRGYRFAAAVAERRAEPHELPVPLPQPQRDSMDGAPETARSDDPIATPTDIARRGESPLASERLSRIVPAHSQRVSYVVIGLVAGLAVSGAWDALRGGAPAVTVPTGMVRFAQESPAGTTLASGGALSPDGRQLVFVAQDERTGKTQLWLRALDSSQPRLLPGTDGAALPFWSPDSKSIGFFGDRTIKRIELSGDPPRVLTPNLGLRPVGASWGAGNLIVFAPSNRSSGLFSVSATGGEPRPLTPLNSSEGEVAHRWPYFLPDGSHFLYSVISSNDQRSGVYVGSVNSADPPVRVLDGSVPSAIYAPGFLLYARKGLLTARPFDVASRRVTGDAFTVAGNVNAPGVFIDTLLSASRDGLLTFGGGTEPEGLVQIDRAGNRLTSFDVPLHNLGYSPDGRQVLGIGAGADQGGGVWILDLERSVPTRIMANVNGAVWAPDGRQMAYVVEQTMGRQTVRLRVVDDGAKDEHFWEAPGPIVLSDWSPDRRYIVYVAVENKQNIWLLPTTGERRPVPYSASASSQIQPQVSPDGRLIAYASDESGIWEVYVDSFPTPSTKRRVSLNGGMQPQWSRLGKELFYLGLDKNVMVAEVLSGRVGRPQPLFRAPIVGRLNNYRNHYAVAPDGMRFIFERSSDQPITMVFNWAAGLR